MKHGRTFSVLLTALTTTACGASLDDAEGFGGPPDPQTNVSGTSRGGAGAGAGYGAEPTGPGMGIGVAEQATRPPQTGSAPRQSGQARAQDDGGDTWGEPVMASAQDDTAGWQSSDADMAWGEGPACDFPTLVESKCGAASCHGGPNAPTGLDLTSPGLARRLEGSQGPGPCADLPMIDPDRPELSALYLKVTGTACGQQMPLNGTTLSTDEAGCFLTWIEGLASPAPGMYDPEDPPTMADGDEYTADLGMEDEPVEDMESACDFPALVQAKCGSSSCHGAPALNTGLDLTSPALAARIGDLPGPGPCADLPMIDRENPELSALYLKVTGTTCGIQMPLTGTLSLDEEACFLTWIEGL